MKAVAATVAVAALAAAPAATAHELTPSQKRVYKHRWQLSAYKVRWYHGQGRWTTRPRHRWCRELRFPRPRGRCYLHRQNLRWHEARVARIGRLLWPPRPVVAAPMYSVGYWASKQIAAATVIGRESAGDPWPNCPDPYDGGGSWYDTVACENGGNWLDSPGYFRCGLQFEPMWEQRFGRLCPA